MVFVNRYKLVLTNLILKERVARNREGAKRSSQEACIIIEWVLVRGKLCIHKLLSELSAHLLYKIENQGG